jgi:K(+)-stimulated pyrophosphate-energized sodium pump
LFFGAFRHWQKHGNENSNQNKCKNHTSSSKPALKSISGGGTVTGLGVAGLAVLGLTGFFHFFSLFHEWDWNSE